MPAITREQALDMLPAALERFDTLELLEVYNEVFPDAPATEEQARTDPRRLVQRLLDHIRSSEITGFVSLWHLVFIKYRNVWYNEEDELIYYNDGTEVYSEQEW